MNSRPLRAVYTEGERLALEEAGTCPRFWSSPSEQSCSLAHSLKDANREVNNPACVASEVVSLRLTLLC